VKSSFHFSRGRLATLCASALMLVLTACGQKGPLYMPKLPEHPMQTKAPAVVPDKSDQTDKSGQADTVDDAGKASSTTISK